MIHIKTALACIAIAAVFLAALIALVHEVRGDFRDDISTEGWL